MERRRREPLSVVYRLLTKQSNGRRASADTDENEHTDSHGLRTQIFYILIRVFLCSSVFSLLSKQEMHSFDGLRLAYCLIANTYLRQNIVLYRHALAIPFLLIIVLPTG